MTDPIPFERGRRRIASNRCEVPGCNRPTIGPLGSPGNTEMVWPCAEHAREKYGTDDPIGIISVLLGGEPFKHGEAVKIWRQARLKSMGIGLLSDEASVGFAIGAEGA